MKKPKEQKLASTLSFEAQYGAFRLDQLLAREELIKSRAVAQKLIDAGSVSVAGRIVKKASTLISRGMLIEVVLPTLPSVPDSKKSTVKLEVLYEDPRCMVVDKPAHIAVHPGTGMAENEETILTALQPLFAKRKLPFSASEVLVHRLDKDTTGCLLIAKTPTAHLELQKQFADRTVQKSYLALVYGLPELRTATIDAPIGRHSTERTRMSIHRSVHARPATTTYRTVFYGKDASLLECDLHTGRTHQIRVHLSSIGHPVIGDSTYGNRASLSFAESSKIESICLHASKLTFLSGKKLATVSAPLPPEFRKSAKKLKISLPD